MKYFIKEESFQIRGILFDVHRNLGGGFSEIVYEDNIDLTYYSKLLENQP
ncbi:hypothetical protein FUMI01_25980 [Flavobacterium sp. UMI-01]|nr:hypothetical protein FUMI01_25980 [Flavobacterium sp. UMI-01]